MNKEPIKIALKDIRCKHLEKILELDGYVISCSQIKKMTTNKKFRCSKCNTDCSLLQLTSYIQRVDRCAVCGSESLYDEGSEEVDFQQIVIADKNEECANSSELAVIFNGEVLSSINLLDKLNQKVCVIGELGELVSDEDGNRSIFSSFCLKAHELKELK